MVTHTEGLLLKTEIWDQLGPLSELVLSGTPVFKEDGESADELTPLTSRLLAVPPITHPRIQNIRSLSYLDVGANPAGRRHEWGSMERDDRHHKEGLGGKASNDRPRDG